MSLLVLVLLIAAAWWGFTQSSAPSSPLTTTGTSGAAAGNSQDQTLVSTLLQLQAVSLNSTVLSDPGFSGLQDFTTQIVSEPIGRSDPFAPLSSAALQSATGTKSVNPNLFAPKK